MTNNTFRKFVIIFVTLIGAGFGTWAGGFYSISFCWIGTLTGIISSFLLAKLYLKIIRKSTDKNKLKIELAGTFTAAACGFLCTALIHGIMLFFNNIAHWQDFSKGEGGIELFYAVLIGCHVFGFLVGLAAGLICSTIYILKVMKNEQ